MRTSLGSKVTKGVLDRLGKANAVFSKAYPGESDARQPVHTVYGGAQLFKADSAQKLGVLALKALAEYAPNFADLARAVEMPGACGLPVRPAEIDALREDVRKDPEGWKKRCPDTWLSVTVYDRVMAKLEREAVEDFRIDFEDGYGNRPDDEEDKDAVRTAEEVAKGAAEGILPPFIGIRIKPFTEDLKARSLRTLDLFVSTLVGKVGKNLPSNFVVTLPKVVMPEQVTALVEVLEALEAALKLPEGTLKLEIMIEMTQAILSLEGNSNLPLLVAAANGRCTGAHFGTYDYTASCSITAAHQVMDHPACDFALHMMKVAYAGTGIFLSNGATNVMPVAPHKKGSGRLTAAQLAENREVVARAWKTAYDHVRHSLRIAYYQGWDLHPAQLPIRYAAVFGFFLQGLEAAATRLKAFMDKAAQATLVGDVFDDAATGQGLLNFFLRGMNCGAISEQEATATGLTLDEIRSRSFLKILEGRRARK